MINMNSKRCAAILSSRCHEVRGGRWICLLLSGNDENVIPLTLRGKTKHVFRAVDRPRHRNLFHSEASDSGSNVNSVTRL